MNQVITTVIPLMLLVLGLSYLVQPGLWAGLSKDAIASPHKYIPLMLLVLVMGLTIVAAHNVWVAGWPVVITVLGWIMIVKSSVFLLSPQSLSVFANWSDDFVRRYIRVAGIALTALGAVLVYQLLIR